MNKLTAEEIDSLTGVPRVAELLRHPKYDPKIFAAAGEIMDAMEHEADQRALLLSLPPSQPVPNPPADESTGD